MGREAECVDDTGIWECVDSCQECQKAKKAQRFDSVDLIIWHRNGHVWPGFAGDPA